MTVDLRTAPSDAESRALVQLADLAEAEAGILIPQAKAGMIRSRLARRLRVTGMADFAAYAAFVTSPAGLAERGEMIGALTTNVTSFFREKHHFDLFAAKGLPELERRARGGARVRLWSAGCSHGQEPYSLAMTILNAIPDAAALDIRILASDIDPAVLQSAEAALYPHAAAAELPDGFAGRFATETGDGLCIAPAVRALVRFRALNLHADWPFRGSFDAIFCRNVMIYFSPERQRRLIGRFAATLNPGGWLFLGHSERLPPGDPVPLAPAGVTTYRRVAEPPARDRGR